MVHKNQLMSKMIVKLLIFVGVPIIFYIWAIKPFSYWRKKNVPTGRMIPIFGDLFRVVFHGDGIADLLHRMYHKITDTRFIGIYQFRVPGLIVKCPELVKQICVKDFDHFVDHRGHLPDDDNKIWSRNIFNLRGQAWRKIRSILNASFTSCKMKKIFELVCNNSNLLVEHLSEKYEKIEIDPIMPVNFKDILTRLTNDIIANTAFGIQVDSLKDRDNEFYMMSREATNFHDPWKKCAFLIHQVCPIVLNLLRLSTFEANVTAFFMNLVDDIIKMRWDQNLKREDTIGLLIEAKNKQQNKERGDDIRNTSFETKSPEELNIDRNLTNGDIASQLFLFLLGGFGNSSVICSMAYELATNLSVQRKLIEEIDANRTPNGSPSYETVMNMTYMDMVISETLRKWPIIPAAERLVTKPYTIVPRNPDDDPVNLEIGVNVIVPIIAFHYDPKYYNNPKKFDPDRFSPENRKNMIPYTYLPFGVGPRMCVGYKFTLLVMKTVFFHLLSHFELVTVDRTEPPKISKISILLTSETDLYLGLKMRNHVNMSKS